MTNRTYRYMEEEALYPFGISAFPIPNISMGT